MTKFLTMNQLAEELKLSRRVVSAVMNNRSRELRISPATEKRVREHLAASGYVRSKSALQLKSGKDNDMIGILYCGKFIDLEYLTASLTLLTQEIRSLCGFSEISGVEPNHLQEGVSEFIAKGIRKLIWIHANTEEEEFTHAEKLFPLFKRLEKVVIFKFDFLNPEAENIYLENGIELVGFDSERSYRETAELFRREGHTTVALNDVYMDSDLPLPGNSKLLAAFREAGLKVRGLHPGNSVPPSEVSRLIAENLAELHRREGVCAAFIRNDLLSVEVMHRLHSCGLRVPDDIALIGFSGSPYSRWLPVPLTTYEHPVAAMCRCTMDLLKAESSTGKAQRHVFENKLILGESHRIGNNKKQKAESKKGGTV